MTDTGGLLDLFGKQLRGADALSYAHSELTFPFRFGTIESTRTSGDKTV